VAEEAKEMDKEVSNVLGIIRSRSRKVDTWLWAGRAE
jgi:hypothetical protein